MLYDMTTGSLVAVTNTSFQAEKVLERTHLQAAVRDDISVPGDDLLVIAEEFGDFEATHRRIDLLCIDKGARLVVVELKRTEDGGHMELQALRYSAMISVMTFEDVVKTFSAHLTKTEQQEVDSDEARARLMDWFDDLDDDDPVVPRQVGIILASADLSQEVTTTVLWLNELYGMDIRCVRLSPYKLDGRLLLDVQHVIPLPEAAELTVKLKKREAAVKKAVESAKDFTKFVIKAPGEVSQPLAKRHAILRMVHAVHTQGIECDQIAAVLPPSKFRAVDGPMTPDSMWDAMVAQLGLKKDQDQRWHLQAPLTEGDKIWVLHGNWGTRTDECLQALGQLTGGSVTAEAHHS